MQNYFILSILSILYFFIIFPIGLLFKIVGYRVVDDRIDEKISTYRVVNSNRNFFIKFLEFIEGIKSKVSNKKKSLSSKDNNDIYPMW
ncbi:hypothetical protein HOL24_08125 [bacterium]|jgi:hypothetical protein|nr:hypothetical protein [bacterium]